MYYKITNKECEVYKKLHELRTKEIEIEKSNLEKITAKIGNDYKKTLGLHGQQNFWRVTKLEGFEFSFPEKVCLKTWKEHKEHKGIFVPNRRTKEGKEMSEFLLNMDHSNYNRVLKILDLPDIRKFSFPFVNIVQDVIILFLGSDHEPKDENVIEITKKEFEDLRKPPLGFEKGEACNREGCIGIIEQHKQEYCSCHLIAPCPQCCKNYEYCPECGWEPEQP